jgi:hypothetical protein
MYNVMNHLEFFLNILEFKEKLKIQKVNVYFIIRTQLFELHQFPPVDPTGLNLGGKQPGPKKIPMQVPVLSTDHVMQFKFPPTISSLDQAPTPNNERVSIRELPERVVAVIKYYGYYSHEHAMRKLRKLHKTLIAEGYLEQPPNMPGASPAADAGGADDAGDGAGDADSTSSPAAGAVSSNKQGDTAATPAPAPATAPVPKESPGAGMKLGGMPPSPAPGTPSGPDSPPSGTGTGTGTGGVLGLDSEARLSWTVAEYHPPYTLPFLRVNEVWVELDATTTPGIRDLAAEFYRKKKAGESTTTPAATAAADGSAAAAVPATTANPVAGGDDLAQQKQESEAVPESDAEGGKNS